MATRLLYTLHPNYSSWLYIYSSDKKSSVFIDAAPINSDHRRGCGAGLASNQRSFSGLNAVYHLVMRIPKAVILVAGILALFGIRVYHPFSPTSPGDLTSATVPVKTSQRSQRRVTESTKKLVAAKQQWKCGQCGRVLDETYEIDHIIPLYRGGSNDAINLMALDPICHRKKTNADRHESLAPMGQVGWTAPPAPPAQPAPPLFF